MRSTQLLRHARPVLAVVLAIVGCASDPAGDALDAAPTDDTVADVGPSVDVAAPLDVAPSDVAPDVAPTDALAELAKTTGTVHGVVMDEAGKGLPGTSILCCSKLNCLYGTSGFGGRFSIAYVPVGDRLVKVTEVDDVSPRRAEAVAPIQVVAGQDLDVGTLYIPVLPPGADLAPADGTTQALDVGDGLVLTLDRSALKAPLGTTTDTIAARRVSLEQVPKTLSVPGDSLVAVYALYPFGMVSNAPIGVMLPAEGPAGPLHLSVIHEVDAVLTPPTQAQSDGTTVSGGAVTRLTWLVVSRPVGP